MTQFTIDAFPIFMILGPTIPLSFRLSEIFTEYLFGRPTNILELIRDDSFYDIMKYGGLFGVMMNVQFFTIGAVRESMGIL